MLPGRMAQSVQSHKSKTIMKRAIRRIIALLFWDGIAERRQNELNEDHMARLGWYVDNEHDIHFV